MFENNFDSVVFIEFHAVKSQPFRDSFHLQFSLSLFGQSFIFTLMCFTLLKGFSASVKTQINDLSVLTLWGSSMDRGRVENFCHRHFCPLYLTKCFTRKNYCFAYSRLNAEFHFLWRSFSQSLSFRCFSLQLSVSNRRKKKEKNEFLPN